MVIVAVPSLPPKQVTDEDALAAPEVAQMFVGAFKVIA